MGGEWIEFKSRPCMLDASIKNSSVKAVVVSLGYRHVVDLWVGGRQNICHKSSCECVLSVLVSEQICKGLFIIALSCGADISIIFCHIVPWWGEGYSHIKTYGDVPQNELGFCKKSLDMGTTFHWKIPRHGSTFLVKAPGHGWPIWLVFVCLYNWSFRVETRFVYKSLGRLYCIDTKNKSQIKFPTCVALLLWFHHCP